MTDKIELISHPDRVALAAQEAVFVLSARRVRRRTQVFVSGPDEECTREVVAQRLGAGVDVLWCGDVPRELCARPCCGYMEIQPGCLQLRYVVHLGQAIAGVEVVEDDDTVVVLGMVCLSVTGDAAEQLPHSYHVYLSRPLGERAVFDAFTRAPIPCREVERRLAA